MISIARQTVNDLLAMSSDNRSQIEQLRDAMKRHAFNYDQRMALSDPGNPLATCAQLDEADLAFEDSQAQLFRLIEDICLVDPVELGQVLTA